ncbi:MAG TPA: hypothetical protein VEJ36_00315 [Nitrososphaerales archaeon]|nr:hypothetical protein [Nitrososphaerales archaeon]
MSISVELFGKRVLSPVGLASGPAPNLAWLSLFQDLGYDILTFKTMRDRGWKGHGMPNILNVRGDFESGFVTSQEFTGSITNSLGMPTPEPEVWFHDASELAKRAADRYFVMSVTATLQSGSGEEDMLEQFSDLSGRARRTGADAVELNLSCPNVTAGEGGYTFADAKLSGRVVDSVRSEVGSGFPIFVKAGYLEDYGPLVDETYDDRTGYVAINSISAPVKGAHGELVFADRGGRAGICGEAIRGYSRKAVSRLASQRKGGRELTIVGLGGVLGPDHAVELLESGANAVESATGAIADPLLAVKTKLRLLEREADSER